MTKLFQGSRSKYNVTRLVYYEEYATMEEAIAREKQIKGGSRQKKVDLIKSSKILSGKICTMNFLSNQPSCLVIAIDRYFRRSNLQHKMRDCFVGKSALLAMTGRADILAHIK